MHPAGQDRTLFTFFIKKLLLLFTVTFLLPLLIVKVIDKDVAIAALSSLCYANVTSTQQLTAQHGDSRAGYGGAPGQQQLGLFVSVYHEKMFLKIVNTLVIFYNSHKRVYE